MNKKLKTWRIKYTDPKYTIGIKLSDSHKIPIKDYGIRYVRAVSKGRAELNFLSKYRDKSILAIDLFGD